MIRLENGNIKRRRLFFSPLQLAYCTMLILLGDLNGSVGPSLIYLVHNASFRVIYIYKWIGHTHGYVDRWGWRLRWGKLSLSLACKCKTSAANRCLSKELASKFACHFWDAKGCHRFNMVHGGFIYHTQTLNVRHVYLHAWLICMVNVGISILLLGNCR